MINVARKIESENPFLGYSTQDLLNRFIEKLNWLNTPGSWGGILWRSWGDNSETEQIFFALQKNWVLMWVNCIEELYNEIPEDEWIYVSDNKSSIADLDIHTALELSQNALSVRYGDAKVVKDVEGLLDPEVSSRMETLDSFDWIPGEKRAAIKADKKHIYIAWKVFQLNDIWIPDARELNAIWALGDIRAEYILPWMQDIYDIFNCIGGTGSQQIEFFREFLKIQPQWWNKSSGIDSYWLRSNDFVHSTSRWPVLSLFNNNIGVTENPPYRSLRKPARLMKQFT